MKIDIKYYSIEKYGSTRQRFNYCISYVSDCIIMLWLFCYLIQKIM